MNGGKKGKREERKAWWLDTLNYNRLSQILVASKETFYYAYDFVGMNSQMESSH